MRIILSAAFMLLLAGCGTTTTSIPVVTPDAAAPSVTPQRGALVGLDASALIGRFGQPRLQVREGSGTKLQFGGGTCLLDAYLYPPASGSGLARVTHIDTRNRDGRPVALAECVRMIEGR